MRPCLPSCPKSCSSKLCDAISRCSRRSKPDGWPASVTRKSGKSWPCCIANQLILGRLLHSRTRWAYRVLSWPSGSGGISRRRPSRTSSAGGFNSARRCLLPRVAALRRSLPRWAMSRSPPLTAPLNVSSSSRRPDSAANGNQPAGQPSPRLDEQSLQCGTMSNTVPVMQGADVLFFAAEILDQGQASPPQMIHNWLCTAPRHCWTVD